MHGLAGSLLKGDIGRLEIALRDEQVPKVVQARAGDGRLLSGLCLLGDAGLQENPGLLYIAFDEIESPEAPVNSRQLGLARRPL